MSNPCEIAQETIRLAFELGGLPSAEAIATEYTKIGDVAAGMHAVLKAELDQLQSGKTPEDPLMEGTTDLTYMQNAWNILVAMSNCRAKAIEAGAAERTLSQLEGLHSTDR